MRVYDNEETPAIIAIGLASGLLIGGAALGIGIAIAISKGHINVSTPWLVPAVMYSLGLSVAIGAITITVKVFSKAVKEPYKWLVPILAIFSGLIVDLCKELYDQTEKMAGILYGALTLLLFFGGGIIWKQKTKLFRLMGAVFYLLPPILVWFKFANTQNISLWEALIRIPHSFSVLLLMSLLLLIFVLIAALSYLSEKQTSDF